MEMVRTINEMSRRARAGEPGVEDYLRAVSADPVTEWFTALLQEKNDELHDGERTLGPFGERPPSLVAGSG